MIAQNAGAEGSIVVAKVKESKDKNFGYNAATDNYEDLVKVGRHRPDQGHPYRAAERGVDRRPAPDDRVRGGGAEGREAGPGRPGRRRHGRDVLEPLNLRGRAVATPQVHCGSCTPSTARGLVVERVRSEEGG